MFTILIIFSPLLLSWPQLCFRLSSCSSHFHLFAVRPLPLHSTVHILFLSYDRMPRGWFCILLFLSVALADTPHSPSISPPSPAQPWSTRVSWCSSVGSHWTLRAATPVPCVGSILSPQLLQFRLRMVLVLPLSLALCSPPLWRPLPPLPLPLYRLSLVRSCPSLLLLSSPWGRALSCSLLRLVPQSSLSVLLVLICSSPVSARWPPHSLCSYCWMGCGFVCSYDTSLVCGRRDSPALQSTLWHHIYGCWCGTALSSSHIPVCRCTCSVCGPIRINAHICCLCLHLWMVRLRTTILPLWCVLWVVSAPSCPPSPLWQLMMRRSPPSVPFPWYCVGSPAIALWRGSPPLCSLHRSRPASFAGSLCLCPCTSGVLLHGLSAVPRICFL